MSCYYVVCLTALHVVGNSISYLINFRLRNILYFHHFLLLLPQTGNTKLLVGANFIFEILEQNIDIYLCSRTQVVTFLHQKIKLGRDLTADTLTCPPLQPTVQLNQRKNC